MRRIGARRPGRAKAPEKGRSGDDPVVTCGGRHAEITLFAVAGLGASAASLVSNRALASLAQPCQRGMVVVICPR